MKKFAYVKKKECSSFKKEIGIVVKHIQKATNPFFTSSFEFVGPESRHMITKQLGGRIGYEFEINITIEKLEQCSMDDIGSIFEEVFLKQQGKPFTFEFVEDRRSTFTIMIRYKKDMLRRLFHYIKFTLIKCDVGEEGRIQRSYIYHNHDTNTFEWIIKKKRRYSLAERMVILGRTGFWGEVRKRYLKNKRFLANKHLRFESVLAQAVNETYQIYIVNKKNEESLLEEDNENEWDE